MAKKTEDQQQNDPALEQGGSLADPAGETANPAAAKVAELEAANAALAAKNAATEETLAKALARLDALEAKASLAATGPIAATPAATTESPYEKQVRLTEERRARFYHHLEQVDAALQDGPNKYQVSLEGEPLMTRTVGAASEFEAEAKYKTYFGILSTKKKLSVTLIESAPVAPATPASEGAGTLA